MRLFHLLLSILFFVITIPQIAQATEWVKYRDEDGIFDILLPENFKINKTIFRVTEKEVLASTEVTANIDQRPYKNSLKQFIVRADHTFAFPPNEKEIPVILEAEASKYIDYYDALGGRVAEKKMDIFAGYPGIELIIAYNDKQFGPQTMKTRIMLADFTRFEQIAIGPMDASFENETKNFFTSLKLNNGRTGLDGSFENEWRKITSPFNLSTVLVPGLTQPYVMEEPAFISNDKLERLTMKIKDPVFNSTLFYSIYGYRLEKHISTENVQKLIMDRHLKKFNIDVRSLQFRKSSYGKMPVLSTAIKFPRPKKFPFMDTIQINAFYFGNFVVIQELVGNGAHVGSPFAKKILSFFEFHPFKANETLEKEKAKTDKTITKEIVPEPAAPEKQSEASPVKEIQTEIKAQPAVQ